MKKIILFIILIASSFIEASAQEDDYGYKMEIGCGTGLVAYEGDFNSNITKNMQPMASVIARRVLNPRMALRLNVSYGGIKGNSQNAGTSYPGMDTNPVSFSKSIMDAGLRYEYNFLPYGTGREYRGALRFTPYITMGLGVTSVSGDGSSAFTMNVPLGAGVKYKVGHRLNIGLEWAMHFSLSDNLDGVKDPYGIESTGIFKNTDCYSALQFTLTYDIMPKCKTCNNNDD